jgi:hypothetical protein
MTAITFTGFGLVLPRKDGNKTVMPAGFHTGVSYRIAGAYTPNGTSDLHVVVVSADGVLTPMLAKQVQILRIDSPQDAALPDLRFDFLTPATTWIAKPGLGRPLVPSVINLLGVVVTPTSITWSGTFDTVTVVFGSPTAGHLILG